MRNCCWFDVTDSHVMRRFHNARDENVLDYDVLPPLDDDVQLSVDEYRRKLYEVSEVDW